MRCFSWSVCRLPGYFSLVNASLRDNYNDGGLTCVGNDFNSTLNCVGFDNMLGNAVFYVTVAPQLQFAKYKMLMGQPGPEAGKEWPCTIH
jgi:hypothetical protein